MARQIVVEVVGDATKFTKTTDEAIGSAGKFGGAWDKLKGSVGQGLGIAGGISIYGAVTDGISRVVDVLGDAGAAYREDAAGQEQLKVALRNNVPLWDENAAAVENYATAQGALGFSDDEVRASLEQLVGVTHDVTDAENLNSLAQDLARAKGISLAEATDIVTKAHEGNGRALKGLGIDIEGVTTGAGFLDAIQRNVAGSAQTWADTNEGKLAVSNVKVGEAVEKMGGIIDKVSSVVMPALADALVFVVDRIDEVWQAIQPLIDRIAKALIPIVQKLGPIVKDVFAVIGNVVKAVAPVFETVFGVIGTVVSKWVDLLSTEFSVVATVVGVIQRVFTTMRDIVTTVFGTVSSVIRSAINTVIGIVNGAIRAINSVQIHISIPGIPNPLGGYIGGGRIDWNGPGLGYIPYLHSGGIVPGSPGSDVLAVLQAGERVSPRGGGPSITINIENFTGTDDDIDRLADRLAARLTLQGAF